MQGERAGVAGEAADGGLFGGFPGRNPLSRVCWKADREESGVHRDWAGYGRVEGRTGHVYAEVRDPPDPQHRAVRVLQGDQAASCRFEAGVRGGGRADRIRLRLANGIFDLHKSSIPDLRYGNGMRFSGNCGFTIWVFTSRIKAVIELSHPTRSL